MPRKTTKSLERKVLPDRKYQSVLVQRLINKSMLDGKKQASERAVYAAIEGAAKKLNSENPVEVLEKAVANVSPDFEVKSRRVGGANYQIPFPISGHRQMHFAFSWLVQSALRKKKILTKWPKPTVLSLTLLALKLRVRKYHLFRVVFFCFQELSYAIIKEKGGK